MHNVEWDSSLETGDTLVDEQHRNIHALVAYMQGADDRPEQIMLVLDRLMDHVACHFASEEDLMERAHYPLDMIEEHVAAHHELKQQARELTIKFRLGEITSISDIADFLNDWLREHVHQRDRVLVDYVRACGEAARLTEEWQSNPPQMNGYAR